MEYVHQNVAEPLAMEDSGSQEGAMCEDGGG
jgi:hypothetical protein